MKFSKMYKKTLKNQFKKNYFNKTKLSEEIFRKDIKKINRYIRFCIFLDVEKKCYKKIKSMKIFSNA